MPGSGRGQAAGGTPRPRVALVSLGCRVNRVEADSMAAGLEEEGAQLVSSETADAVIVNTCAVTAEAEAKARKAVRHAADLPQAPAVLVTGCAAGLDAAEFEGLAPRVEVVADKARVAERAVAAAQDHQAQAGPAPQVVPATQADDHHVTPTGRMRPGVKVQDGCDNRCTYCIVWKARGKARSVEPGRVLADVRSCLARGAHEVVLTGINLGCYQAEGPDGRPLDLAGLVELVLDQTEVERVRLGSIEPPDVTEALVATMAAHPQRVAPFLHVCLQSGCDATLGRMGRVYDTALYRQVVEVARQALPDLALGCDLIVGFPGETDEEFEESLAFCQQMAFAKMHVFRYSRRPGTPAATMEGQVPPQVMADRSHRMLQLARQMRLEAARSRLGKVEDAIVQYPGRAVTGGLLDIACDPAIPLDSLVRLRVESVLPDATLLGVRA